MQNHRHQVMRSYDGGTSATHVLGNKFWFILNSLAAGPHIELQILSHVWAFNKKKRADDNSRGRWRNV